ncbi:MAG: hypothetical protein JWO32_1489 [Bacteroidetes bacterium]|nr:hypothetical protein [Bacteroidota bacterium]
MKSLYKFLIVVGLLLTLTTCHKYPEGGWSNVAIRHLFGGTEGNSKKVWKIKLYEVNGIDSTAYLFSGNGITNFENVSMTLRLNNARAHDYYFYTSIFKGVLQFNENKNITHIAFPNNKYNCLNNVCERNIYYPEFNGSGFFWKIVRLKKNELILTNSATNNYKLIFTY